MGGAEPLDPATADLAGYQALRGQAARMAAMAELSRELAGVVPDLGRVAALVVRRTAESLRDACVLNLFELFEQSGGETAGAAHIALHDPHPGEGKHRAAALASVMEPRSWSADVDATPPVLRTSHRVWLPEPDVAQVEAMLGPRSAAYIRDVGVTSLVAAPLIVRGRQLGVIVCLRAGGAYNAADAAYVQELADRAALAIDNGQLYAAATTELAERRRAQADLRARAVQQAAVAELSQRALARVEPAELMQDAVLAVAGALEAPLVGLAELDAGQAELVLRAGVGWREDALGAPMAGELAAGSWGNLTLAAEEPVAIEDLSADARVTATEVLRDHGVNSGVCVPVIGSLAQLGVLGTFDIARRRGDRDCRRRSAWRA